MEIRTFGPRGGRSPGGPLLGERVRYRFEAVPKVHVGGGKYIRRVGAQQGRRGHRCPQVCRYGYDSRGANFCVKIIDFPVSRLFVIERIKASHEGPRKVSLFYTHERTFVAKPLKGAEARDACHAFNSFAMKHHFSRSGGLGGRVAGTSFSLTPEVRGIEWLPRSPSRGRVRDAKLLHAFTSKRERARNLERRSPRGVRVAASKSR